MKLWCSFIVTILFSASVFGVTSIAKQKYPYQLLTDDHDILNENDLAGYTWRMNPAPFEGKCSGLKYWQCFPRENVSIILEDSGSPSEDFIRKDNAGDIQIKIWIKKGIFHEYVMPRVLGVEDLLKDFIYWRKIMKGSKYVCLGGQFVDHKKTMDHGASVEAYEWIFDKIKTKQGCSSYFDGDCDHKYNNIIIKG